MANGLKACALGADTILTNTFDLFGNKTAVWEANSDSSSSAYNAFGEVISATNAKGQTTLTAADVLGRPKTVTRPEPGGPVTYTYLYDSAPGAGTGEPHQIKSGT